MTPTWSKNGVTLYCADCRDVLPTLGKVDAVVTDPPYGLGVNYESFDDTLGNVQELTIQWIPEAKEIANRIIVTCGLLNIGRYPQPDWIMAWFFPGAGPSGPWGFMGWQPILCYGPDPYLAAGLGRRPDTVMISAYARNETSHPCPKPVKIMDWIIERTSFSTHTILDPFMGSGTTGVASVRLGRKFIGIEIEPKYFEIAVRRIEAAFDETSLLDYSAKQEQLDLAGSMK